MSVARGDTNVHCSLHDPGPVIPPAWREAVFEPVAKLPVALGPGRAGLGSGLSAARRLARRMRGDIWLAAGAPRGNLIVVRMPLVTESQAP